LVFMDMDIRSMVRFVLKEVNLRNGARDIVRMMMGLQKLRMLETSSDATGRVVSWFRSEQDGHLYEIVVSPVKHSVFEVPDQLKPAKNENEPLSPNDVENHIKARLEGSVNGVTMVRDSAKYYDFVVHFDSTRNSKEDFAAHLLSKISQGPLKFAILPSSPPSGVYVRYYKV